MARKERKIKKADKLFMVDKKTERIDISYLDDDIYFLFDSYMITPESSENLRQKAKWFSINTDVSIIIQGHCDERGTNEYNLALGDRRAETTKAFLVDLGISPSRLITISYGEERSLIGAKNEDAWAKNRRAHFAVK